MNFNDLPIETKLKNSIKFAEFKIPTPIQSKSIPISLVTPLETRLTSVTSGLKTFESGLRK